MMRSNDKKVIVILELLLALALFNNFIYNFFTNNSINYIILWSAFLLAASFLLGFKKDKSLHTIDIVQIIVIYSFLYLIITYLLGLIFGYTKTIYNLAPLKIILNILPAFVLIIMEELFRYIIIDKSYYRFNYVLLILTFIVLETSLGFSSYSFNTPMDVFNCIAYLIIPCIVNNLLLTYISKKSGYMPTIVYRLIFGLYIYLVPVFPDFGVYIGSLFNIIFPTILFIRLNSVLAKPDYKAIKSRHFASILFSIPILAFLTLTVTLVSGLFTYYAMAIGSNSMDPVFSKGDAVIVRKLNKDDLKNIEIGDIIVYSHDNKYIVHRVIKIKNVNGKLLFNTKGDNNDSNDAWDIEESDIKGRVRTIIKYIGYPSIWL